MGSADRQLHAESECRKRTRAFAREQLAVALQPQQGEGLGVAPGQPDESRPPELLGEVGEEGTDEGGGER